MKKKKVTAALTCYTIYCSTAVFFYDATVLKMTLYCTVHMLKLSVVILIVKLCFEEERSILQ